MAHHVWSVLCYKAPIDKDTNEVSLLNVVENLTIHTTEAELQKRVESLKEGEQALLPPPGNLELVSWWVRSDFDIPEEGVRARVALRLPDGREQLTEERTIDLQERSGFRLKYRVPGIPFGGVGAYWFEVQQCEMSEDQTADGWRIMARVPLRVYTRSVNHGALLD